MNESRPVSVLFIQRPNGYVALWLETNIAAQAREMKEAWSALKRTIEGQFILDNKRGRMPFEGKEPAPPWYWNAFAEGELVSLESIDGQSQLDRHFTVKPPRQVASAAA